MSVTSRLKNPINGAKQLVGDELIAAFTTMPIRRSTVLYESFSGNGILCNPEAIFRAALADPELSHLKHVWVISDKDAYASTLRDFAGNPRVKFVEYRSARYYHALGTSRYLVNNSTFPHAFVKRKEQTYLNTWHGVPLKAMGYDMPGGAYESRNVLRNFVSANFLLSANPFMTERMYKNAYRLEGFYQGKIIETGHPRTDYQFTRGASGARSELRNGGVSVGQGPIVLYAPTWRGASFHRASADIALIRSALRAIEEGGTSEMSTTVLLKVHQQVFDQLRDEPEFEGKLVPNEIPTNRMLSAADVLVTDYSSIFFDYLSLDRPIIFFAPDLQGFREDRGLYIEPGDWPGNVVQDPEGLTAAVEQALGKSSQDYWSYQRPSAARTYCPRDDGGASQRVVDILFKGKYRGQDLIDIAHTNKPKVLMYLGGMKPNGVTTSALGLLDNIDHSRVDVSVLYSETADEDTLGRIAEIGPAVRQFVRVGRMTMSRLDNPGRNVAMKRGRAPATARKRTKSLFALEWRRLFGESTFDHVIDFSGYSPYWALVLLASGSPKASVWLHNDLTAEVHKEVGGRFPHRKTLPGLFSLYRHFDYLVSVSPTLADINRRKLGSYADAERFVYAINTLPTARIDALTVDYSDCRPLRTTSSSLPEGDIISTMDEVFERFRASDLWGYLDQRRNLDRWMPDRANATTFVSVGRLSPEKNFARLIRAFAPIHAERPDTRLLIIGSGPLETELREFAAQLGLVQSVSLAGHQDNPYQFMTASDCLVMSSNYEGQPMVLLEARYLGLPVVITRFDSAPSALAQDEGLIVDQSVEALTEGLRAFLNGEVPTKPFDASSHNMAAIHQFYRVIGLPSGATAD